MIDPDDNTVEDLIEHLKDQQQIILTLHEARYATRTAARDTERLDRDIDGTLREEISEMDHIITALENSKIAGDEADTND